MNFYLKKFLLIVILPVAAVCCAACTNLHLHEREATFTSPPPLSGLPAIFEGTVPCGPCAPSAWRLDIRPDGVFFLRYRYPKIGEYPEIRTYDMGRWEVSDDGGLLLLLSENKILPPFSFDDHVRLCNTREAGFCLIRSDSYEPLEPILKMRGMYSSKGDARSFRECLTGLDLLVVKEADYAALESAYARVGQETREPILVLLEGVITLRESMEEGLAMPVIIPRVFFEIVPGETCE